jgi:hypothetical protein
MGFEFVDFLDEDLCVYVAELKEANEFESWIGLDSQSQAYPTIAAQPREQHQRLAAPAKRPDPAAVQEAEVIEEKPARSRPRSRTEALETAKEPVGRSSRHSRGEDEPVPGKALAEARALGARQGERKLTPVEIAQQRARASMGRS